MNFMQIKLFIDIAQSHSIHKTANKYNMSSQGASKALLTLEKELGVFLLERSNLETVFTNDGKDLYEKMKTLSDVYDDVMLYCGKQSSLMASNRITGEITLATIPRFVDAYLSDILVALHDKYPKIKLRTRSMMQNEILEQLTNPSSDIDCAIISAMDFADNKKIFQKYLDEAQLSLSIFYSTELYACGITKNIKQIGEFFYINKPILFPIAAYDSGIYLKNLCDTLDFRINSLSALINLMNNAQAIISLSKEEFNIYCNSKKHSYIPYEPQIILNYGFLYKKDKRLSQAEVLLQNFLENEFLKSLGN